MTKNRVRAVMLGACAGAALMPTYATAQQSQPSQQTLQAQIDQMQQQIDTMQKQVADSKKAAQHAADLSQAAALKGAYGADLKAGPTKAPLLPDGVKLYWGGFIEAAGIWRSRNEAADVGSDFNNIPYPISPLYHENETRFSARQSRLFFGADGQISPTQMIKAYFEMDFLGAATTANSIESNSYNPRIRQAFLNYDDNYYGWHVAAGQMWSLATQNRNGIVNRQENIPLTIDAQYVVGFNWTRNAAFRVVKDFGPTFAIAASAESPQVRFQTPGAPTPLGVLVTTTENGTQSGLMDTLQGYSIDQIPDFIEKAAWDPGWGHYEAFGLQRWFTDRSQQCLLATVACAVGGANPLTQTATNNTTFGWGVGGSVLLPALPKFLDLQGSVLYGNGIGRYGSGQLPDVTIAPNGSLATVTALHTMVGAVAHLTPDLDVYAYAGLEKAQSNFSTLTNGVVNQTGFGNPNFSDALCATENAVAAPAVPTSDVTGVLTNAGCSVNVKQLTELTVGFWQNFYKGPMGRLTGGAQVEYIHRDTFAGTQALLPGSNIPSNPISLINPATDELVVMGSLRYYFP
jgi:hypothetical protein